jgi:DNA-binding NarL/FixJ family response regulator
MPADPPAPDGQLRIVLVDADDLVRETIAALLAIGDRIEVVGTAGSAGPALDLVTTAQPDVVLVDPRLPDFDGGLAFIRQVHQAAPVARVLVACTPELLDRAAAADGVDGCFRKTFRPDDLTAAIVAASRAASA